MRARSMLVGLLLVVGGLSACDDDGASGVDIAAIDVPAAQVATVTFTAGSEAATFEARDGVFYPGAGATPESATLLNVSASTFPVYAYRILEGVDLATPDYGLVSTVPGGGRPAECGAECSIMLTATDGSVHKLRVGAPTFNSAGFYATVEGDPRVFLVISATVAQIISLATGRPFTFPKSRQELELEAKQAQLAAEARGRGAPEANYDPYLRQVLAAEQDRKAAKEGRPGDALVRAATSTQDQPGGGNGLGATAAPSARRQPAASRSTGRNSPVSRRPRVLRGAVAGIAGAVALSLALGGCGGGGVPEIAATVEGTEITSAEVESLYQIFANTQAGASGLQGVNGVRVDPKQIRATALSYRIKIAYIEYLAEREGAVVPEDDTDQALYDELTQIGSLKVSGYQPADLKVAARAEAISKTIAAKLLPEPTVTREELQQAYDERKDIVGKSFRATTGIAFMDTEASALELKKALDSGTDFTQATDSLNGTLAAQTVDINPISPIQPELIEAVRKLDPGKTSDPIRYDVGDVPVYTVLYQVKRKDLPALTLEQATPELTKIVQDHKRFVVFDDWLKKQYLTARITVDEYYGKWDPAFQLVV